MGISITDDIDNQDTVPDDKVVILQQYLLYYEFRNVKDQDAMGNDKSTQDDAPKTSSNHSRSVFVLLLLYKFFTSEQSSCLKR